MDQISICYLSWKKTDIFEKTLKSHLDHGLFDIIAPENRIIFFQETSRRDIELADRYNCKYIASPSNIGILQAYVMLVQNCNTKYFIFCENDFLLNQNNENFNIHKTMEDCVELLNENQYAQIKLSNTLNPGFLYSRPQDPCTWCLTENYPYKVESLSWIKDPELFYGPIKKIYKNYKWYVFNNSDQNWSNHIYICNTSFLKDIVVPILKHNVLTNQNLDIRYQGLEETLQNPDKIQFNLEIHKLINLLKMRTILTGGGNFFHNKV